jgi:hypothetical protein
MVSEPTEIEEVEVGVDEEGPSHLEQLEPDLEIER